MVDHDQASRRKLTPLSPEAREARKPLPPDVLAGALQDRVHTNPRKGRVPKIAKCNTSHKETPMPANEQDTILLLLDEYIQQAGFEAALAVLRDAIDDLEPESLIPLDQIDPRGVLGD